MGLAIGGIGAALGVRGLTISLKVHQLTFPWHGEPSFGGSKHVKRIPDVGT